MASISWVGLPSSRSSRSTGPTSMPGLPPRRHSSKNKKGAFPRPLLHQPQPLGLQLVAVEHLHGLGQPLGPQAQAEPAPKAQGVPGPPGHILQREAVPLAGGAAGAILAGDARPRRGVGRVAGDAVQTPRREQRPKLPGVPLHNVHRGGKAVFLHRAPGLPGGLLLHLHPGDGPRLGAHPPQQGNHPAAGAQVRPALPGPGRGKVGQQHGVRAKGVLGTYQHPGPAAEGLPCCVLQPFFHLAPSQAKK